MNYPQHELHSSDSSGYDLAAESHGDRQPYSTEPDSVGFYGASRYINDTYSEECSKEASSHVPPNTPSTDNGYIFTLRVFMLTSITSATLVLILEAFMFGVINSHKENISLELRYIEMSIYLALFIFAAIYQILITLIGLRTKNMLLLSMLCFFYACMLVYTGIQYHELSQSLSLIPSEQWNLAIHATNIAAIAVLAATFVAQVSLIYFRLWQSVRWFQFKKIGASLEIKRLNTIFQIHRSLLIFDFFFFLGFTVQFIVIMVGNKSSLEFILTCCMLPLTILVLVASDFAATRELLVLSLFTSLCFIGGCVYVLFKIVRLYTRYTSAYRVALEPGDYFPGRTSLVTFGVITLVFLFMTLALEIMVMCGYRKGLLPYVRTSYGLKKENNQEGAFVEEEKASDDMLID